MSLFLDAARLLTNLGSLGEQFIGVDGPKFSGEYLAASVTSMGADGLAAGSVLYKWKRQGELRGPVGAGDASIILKTLVVVEVLELMTGFGPPYEGDDLKVGSEQFTTLYEQVKSALPDDNWQGSASQAYANEDAPLQTLAQTLAALDLQLAAIVKNQADSVTLMRLGFGMLKDLLIAAFAIELAIKTFAPSPANLAAAQIFALAVCVDGIAVATGMLARLVAFSIENADKANDLIPQYNTVTTTAVPTGTPLAQTEVPATVESRVSSLASGMSGMLAMPNIATLASLAPEDASAEQRTLPRALTGAAEARGDGTPAEAPDETTPSTPAFTMPTLAQLAQMSGQAARISGHVGQHMNPVNQMTGQAQQFAATDRQGQQAAAPSEDAVAEEAVLVGAAPVEATVRPAPGSTRHPLEA